MQLTALAFAIPAYMISLFNWGRLALHFVVAAARGFQSAANVLICIAHT